MPGAKLIGTISALVLIGILGLVAYSIWFCAEALNGALAGCVASATPSTLLSPPILFGLTAASVGLYYSKLRRK